MCGLPAKLVLCLCRFLSYFPCSVLVGCNLLKFLGNCIISLVQPGKIVDHTIGVDNLRPITVLSCWYRIWAIVPGLRIL